VGLGNFEPEWKLFGLDKRKQVSRFEEAIELLQRAWRGEDINFQGQHFQVHGTVRPKPVGAELWIGATSEPGVRRAARFGCKWIAGPVQKIQLVREWADLYVAAGQEFGTSSDLGIVLLRDGWVGDSIDEVERDFWPHLRHEHWFSFSHLGRFMGERETTFAGVETESDMKFATHRRDRLVVGSPDDCIRQIEDFQKLVAIDYLIMQFRVASGPSFDDELRCIRQFGAQVIPAFK
jgi:alkanesulfonate monooxygenase SsuD/methylene tetrahydromethanopterin reductase-like flavin-dependent oxidoreductase (luciferase family)